MSAFINTGFSGPRRNELPGTAMQSAMGTCWPLQNVKALCVALDSNRENFQEPIRTLFPSDTAGAEFCPMAFQ